MKDEEGRTVGFFPDTLTGLCVEPVGPSLWVAVLGLKEVRRGAETGAGGQLTHIVKKRKGV